MNRSDAIFVAIIGTIAVDSWMWIADSPHTTIRLIVRGIFGLLVGILFYRRFRRSQNRE